MSTQSPIRSGHPLRRVLVAAVLAQAMLPPGMAQQAPSGEPVAESQGTPAPDDPTRTAGGALALFMSRRHYLAIRELKAVMTPELQARFDHDSAPFNGKRSSHIAAFEFSEKDLKAVPQPASRTAGLAPRPPEAVPAIAPGPAAYLATVQSLWEEQGEAIEARAETMRLVRREDGLWRVASLERLRSESLRFRDAVPGVTALRLVLRAWVHGDPKAARANMTPAFLKKFEGREQAFQDLIVGPGDPRHAAYQIVELKPDGPASASARVRLFDSHPGQPSPLDGSTHVLRLVKKGSPWLLDAWN